MTKEKELMIGLEIHAELDTKTKLFCGCKREHAEPNTLTCPTCLGLPGAKPRTNEKAFQYALKLALALQSEIAKDLIFSRKIYFYPDLAKNFQTTQFEHPIGNGGKVTLTNGKEISLKRVHLEEDPGALIHPTGSIATSGYTLIDYNRSGHPLCEIVTDPVIESPQQAREFMKTLLTILQYLEIFDQNTCIIKADANVSIKESNFTRVEIKNIGSFKDIEKALEYEIARQKKEVSEGKTIVTETRGYQAEKEITIPLRKKESEEDYGYITEPDLVPIPIKKEQIKKIKNDLPILPRKMATLMIDKGVPEEDAYVISAEYELAILHETISKAIDAKRTAHVIRRDIPRILRYHKLEMKQIDPNIIQEILILQKENTITERTTQKLLEEYSNHIAENKTFSPKAYVEKHQLQSMDNTEEIKQICKSIIQQNPKAIEDLKAGNEKSMNFLFGQVMRQTKGKADANQVKEILEQLIKG